MTGGHAVDVQRRLFALLAVMALLLAACSGGGTATPSAAESAAPPSEAAPTEAAPTEAAAEPVTVEFYDLHINEPACWPSPPWQ
jgi:ABC-type glycerol-3-phosphate transport system substrate-binding protein